MSGVKFRILECVQVRVGHLHILALPRTEYRAETSTDHINYHDTIPVSCQLPRSTFCRINGSIDKTARDIIIQSTTPYSSNKYGIHNITGPM